MIKKILVAGLLVGAFAFAAGAIVGSRLAVVGLIDKGGFTLKPKKLDDDEEVEGQIVE